MFEAIEESLKGTLYESLVDEMFLGECNSYIVCQKCGHVITVPEKFMDLPMFVNQMQGV